MIEHPALERYETWQDPPPSKVDKPLKGLSLHNSRMNGNHETRDGFHGYWDEYDKLRKRNFLYMEKYTYMESTYKWPVTFTLNGVTTTLIPVTIAVWHRWTFIEVTGIAPVVSSERDARKKARQEAQREIIRVMAEMDEAAAQEDDATMLAVALAKVD